jgi:hypothetical protein
MSEKILPLVKGIRLPDAMGVHSDTCCMQILTPMIEGL